MPDRVDIVPDEDEWLVKSSRALRRAGSKREAKRWARNNLAIGTSVWVHDSTGKFQNEFTIRGG